VNASQSGPPIAPFQQPAGPPYALTSPSFRFRALASLAGRAPLGGAREVVLATYLVARLVDDCRPSKALPSATRTSRSAAAHNWLANTALPSAVRTALVRLVEATEGDRTTVTSALPAVLAAADTYLDEAARLELERLARDMTG
jgi:hypothetical protein